MRYLLLAGLFLSVFASASAQADQAIYFDPFPKGVIAKQVKVLWKNEAEYKDYVASMDMAPDFMMGLYDINGDGQPEVFARHSDPELGFCDADEIACRMVVYANTKKGLIEIGRFMAGQTVVASDRRNRGVRDIIVTLKDKKRATYIWNGKKLEAK